MSTYYGTTRTNYFRTTNEARLREILDSCDCDDGAEIVVWKRADDEGNDCFAFACGASINGLIVSGEEGDENEREVSYSAFAEALQEILLDGEVILVTEVGHEKLCDLVGTITVITDKEVKTKDLYEVGIAEGRRMLGDDKWRPRWW